VHDLDPKRTIGKVLKCSSGNTAGSLHILFWGGGGEG